MTDSLVHLKRKLEQHHRASYGWAVACCKYNHEQGAEVLQTAYLKILEGRAVFNGRSSFKTWLFSVIRNTARDQLRKDRIRSVVLSTLRLEPVTHPDPDEEMHRSLEEDRLGAALSSLSKRQQEVLHLVFYQDLTLQEAGHVLGISTGSAARHYARGKAILRDKLADWGEP